MKTLCREPLRHILFLKFIKLQEPQNIHFNEQHFKLWQTTVHQLHIQTVNPKDFKFRLNHSHDYEASISKHCTTTTNKTERPPSTRNQKLHPARLAFLIDLTVSQRAICNTSNHQKGYLIPLILSDFQSESIPQSSLSLQTKLKTKTKKEKHKISHPKIRFLYSGIHRAPIQLYD